MELKHCPKCHKDFPKTPEYFYYYEKRGWWHTYCRVCENEIVKARNKRNIKSRLGDDDELWHIRQTPNDYKDEAQRMEVFNVMKLMGWKFSPENGIWYKNNIANMGVNKDKNGKWNFKNVHIRKNK
jgi:hypothetical protein